MTTAFNSTYIGFILYGAVWTILLSAIAFVGGGLAGAAVALCRISPLSLVRSLTGTFIVLVQGTPLLVILFLVYFGLPGLGITLSPIVSAAIALTIYVSAYLGEIWRGALLAVPKVQWESAECLAFSPIQRMTKVILPQALRIGTPPTVGFTVQLIKNTSLASAVGFVELTRSGQLLNNFLFEPFPVYMMIAAIYFSICYPISLWSRRLERQFKA